MIPSIALMLALNGTSDPLRVGPIDLGMATDRIVAMLGATNPFVVCDAAHYGYTDANATVMFDGLAIVLKPHPSKVVRRVGHSSVAPIVPLASSAPAIWSWRFMGYPVFAMADHLPGFRTLKPRKGERLHLSRSLVTDEAVGFSGGRIDYVLMEDGTVAIGLTRNAESE